VFPDKSNLSRWETPLWSFEHRHSLRRDSVIVAEQHASLVRQRPTTAMLRIRFERKDALVFQHTIDSSASLRARRDARAVQFALVNFRVGIHAGRIEDPKLDPRR